MICFSFRQLICLKITKELLQHALYFAYVCPDRIGFPGKLMTTNVYIIQGHSLDLAEARSLLSEIEMPSLLTALSRSHFVHKQTFAKMKSLNRRAFYCCIFLADYYCQYSKSLLNNNTFNHKCYTICCKINKKC